MNSQDVKNAISGVLVVDKPVGMTSHDVVQVIRNGTGLRRAGHTGTLDPRASGVLVILVGPAVRLSEYVSASDKRYQAIIRLGSSTDTFDADGKFTRSDQPVNVTEAQFEEVLKTFIGEIEQTPPPYSAVKVQGRKAYEMARQGEEVDLTPRKIMVHHLEVLEWAPPEVVIDVHCSSGTYVRSLANDLGVKLGCGAYLVGLRRTKSGRFSLRDATPLRKLQEAFHAGNWYQFLIPAAEALGDWPAIELSPDEVEGVRHGHRVKSKGDEALGDKVRGVSTQGELVALMELVTGESGTPEWQPKKVFFTSEEMQHFHSLQDVTLQSSWLTIGVFDGVHRGHQEILKILTAGAHANGAPAVVLTFHPHPAVTLGGRIDLKLLTLPEERADLLATYGVDIVITHPFDRELANTTAHDFMALLKGRVGVKHMVLGYDAALGKGREGNAARLTKIGRGLDYGVEVVAALSDESGVISSTEIRKLVGVGNMSEAEKLLGHKYSLQGEVVHGDHRGKTINVPTANVDYAEEKLIPAHGIYACWAYMDDAKYKAAVNIGLNPTFTPDRKNSSVEAYLLDFDRDVYGSVLRLEFVERLRDELKFGSVDALLDQIWADVARVRDLLSTE